MTGQLNETNSKKNFVENISKDFRIGKPLKEKKFLKETIFTPSGSVKVSLKRIYLFLINLQLQIKISVDSSVEATIRNFYDAVPFFVFDKRDEVFKGYNTFDKTRRKD